MLNVSADPQIHNRLVLYHRVLESAPGRAMMGYLAACRTGRGVEEAYLAVVRSLCQEGPAAAPQRDGWQNHLLERVLTDENPFSTGAAAGMLPPELLQAAAYDLRLLQTLFSLTAEHCRSAAGSGLPMWPSWGRTSAGPAGGALAAMAEALAGAPDWGRCAQDLAAYHRQSGAGLFCSYWYLQWTGQLDGIGDPDLFDLDDLVGIDQAKATVLRNTEQFLRGGPANNLLLYGSRGTGKSSMVRGLAARYGSAGLRLVAVARSAIGSVGELFRRLRNEPYRFVLFLDDLSFDEAEADYKAFKSMVEGTLEQRPANVTLYATTNRRHLVPERWSDRHTPDTAEVHGQDTMEEKLSLADRFGITVLFTAPTQVDYLAIVEHMAEVRGLQVPREVLHEEALRWVMWQNARSGRAARQFLDDLEGRYKG
ncbi:MAG TPA: ATP-binding protein [Symbiobacteriaceae bacterium]|nr:ATP-binding protein [Symbiobacteriaceae bacterium]